ncbi:MAG: hypothetical protein U1E83_04385 [Methylotetracoccus sp.]
MNQDGAAVRDLAAGALPWAAYGLGGLGFDGGVPAGLGAAALIAIRLPGWRDTKIFDLAVLVYFLLIALADCCLAAPIPPTLRAALCPALLAATALGSLALGRPATLQYARPMVDPAWWYNPHFMFVNRVLTWTWSACFLIWTVVALLLRPQTLVENALASGFGTALFAASAWFSWFFPRWYRYYRYLPLVRAGREPFLPTRRPH